MTKPTQPSAGGLAGLARDAAAPLLLLAALAAALLATSAVWVAAGVAALLGSGSWTTPAWSLALLPRLLTDGVSALIGPAASTVGFVAALVMFAAVAIGIAALGWQRTWLPRNLGARSLCAAMSSATSPAIPPRRRRASSGPTSHRPSALLARSGGNPRRAPGRTRRAMSWEDVALIIMAPRSNKTSALAVPAVRAAPAWPSRPPTKPTCGH